MIFRDFRDFSSFSDFAARQKRVGQGFWEWLLREESATAGVWSRGRTANWALVPQAILHVREPLQARITAPSYLLGLSDRI